MVLLVPQVHLQKEVGAARGEGVSLAEFEREMDGDGWWVMGGRTCCEGEGGEDGQGEEGWREEGKGEGAHLEAGN